MMALTSPMEIKIAHGYSFLSPSEPVTPKYTSTFVPTLC